MKVNVIMLKDINDKDLYYIRIENETGQKHNINVGVKTANAIIALVTEPPKELKEHETTDNKITTAAVNNLTKKIK